MEAIATEMHQVCAVDDLWDGEMESVEIDGTEILLVKHDGAFLALQGICPHQDIPLVEGKFENGIVTCRAHLWQFDATTGQGVNPSNCRLKRYPVAIEDGQVLVGHMAIED